MKIRYKKYLDHVHRERHNKGNIEGGIVTGIMSKIDKREEVAISVLLRIRNHQG